MNGRYYVMAAIGRYTRAVSEQWFVKRAPAASTRLATIEVLLEKGCFCVVRAESYKEDNWGDQVSSVRSL
jgi:hypothetical protein